MRHPAALIAIATGLALAVTGCGGGDTTVINKAADQTTTTTTTTTSTETPDPSPSGPPPTPPNGGVVLPGKGFVEFRTPSGNILCGVDTAQAACQIIEADWSPPPRPPDCDLDWGRGVSVAQGEAAFYCYGGIVADPSSPIVRYGQRIVRGPFACDSQENGLTCENEQTGHGFFLAREEVQVY